MATKINQLTKMKISEISLVTDPASPGADIIFTKAETRVRKFDPDEPRDDRGRWTSRAVAALGRAGHITREAAQSLSNHARTLATKVASNSITSAIGDRVSALGSGAVAHTASAIISTRPRGAHPVAGGGVQFNFEHKLADGSMLTTHVQVRPEHIPQGPVKERVVRNMMTGQRSLVNEGTETHWHAALRGLNQVLRRGGLEEKAPFSNTDRPNWLSYKRTSAADVAEQEYRAKAIAVDTERKRKDELERLARPQLFNSGSSAYSGGGSGSSVGFSMRGADTGAPLPLSTETSFSGKRQMAPGGIPEYVANEHATPHIRELQRQTPEGKGEKTADDFPIPLPGHHTHATAGGWAYYYHNTFIPAGRPDIQAHAEHVHDELARNEALRNTRARQMELDVNPSNSGGRAYFDKRGNYIPHGSQTDQISSQTRHYNELMRRQDIGEHVYEQHKPSPAQNLFTNDDGTKTTEETARKSDDLRVPSKDAVAEFMRTKGVTHVPAGHAAGGFSQHERIGVKPTVAKMLFK